MKIELGTRMLQDMVSKSIKGCSNNKMLPMTSIMAIQLKSGILTLTTTDMTNYLYVSKVAGGEEFYVTVKADMFAKLVLSITSETITLGMADKYLEVGGNGSYKIDVVLDENGKMIDFPVFEEVQNKLGTIPITTVKTILNSIKPALAKDIVTPAYTNYFVGNSVIATDTDVIAIMNTKLFDEDKSLFISSELMDLVGLCTDDVTVGLDGQDISFVTDNVRIRSTLYDYTDQFQTDDINALAEQEFPSLCYVNKAVLLQTLDRLALFLDDDFSNGVINLKFAGDSLTVESALLNGIEELPYVNECKHAEDFECAVDITALRDQIKPYVGDDVQICYGREDAIKLVNENIITLIGLLG